MVQIERCSFISIMDRVKINEYNKSHSEFEAIWTLLPEDVVLNFYGVSELIMPAPCLCKTPKYVVTY